MRVWVKSQKSTEEKTGDVEKRPYAAPAVIFESEITTRAGSPTGIDPNGIDPTDLFD